MTESNLIASTISDPQQAEHLSELLVESITKSTPRESFLEWVYAIPTTMRKSGDDAWQSILLAVATVCLYTIWAYVTRNREPDYTPEEFAKFKSESSSATNLLSREQMDAIVLRQWKKVMAWVVFHSDQVPRVEDTNGQTVLHHAVLFRAPEQVMELLLWAAPELASLPNKEGELALHWAARLSIPIPTMSLLLRANPEGAFLGDCHGTTPISLLWERHQVSLIQNWRSEREKLLNEKHGGWRRIMSIYRALDETRSAKREDDEPCQFEPMHIAAAYPSPPSLFPLMVQVYHHDINKVNKLGQTPLSIACSSPLANRSCDVLTKIQLLLQEGPLAASFVDPQGRYPLHRALCSEIMWDGGVKALIQACPQALFSPDPTTGLLPFLLAGVNFSHSTEKSEERELLKLETVYNTLRIDPSTLRLCGY